MNKTSRSILTIALLVAALAAFFIFRKRAPEPQPDLAGKLVVRFLDVGQGDAELISLPNGETILIDSGDRGSPAVELLKKYGVRQIDLIIATHPHSDHIGEMRDVMRAFKVTELWDAGFKHTTKTYTDMLQEINARGVKFATPKRGDLRKFGDVLLEVLNPSPDLPDDEANNASIVVRLTYGDKRFLFTGDAEMYETAKPSAWAQMIAADKNQLRADLLKAAHHGSSNGTTRDVLDAVRPSIVTISCAAGNDYHHPHPKVMRMLEEAADRIKLYRTDLEGTLTAVCDGNSITMSTEREAASNTLYLTGDQTASRVAGEGRRQNPERGSRGGKSR